MYGQDFSGKFMLGIMFSQYVCSWAPAERINIVANINMTKVATMRKRLSMIAVGLAMVIQTLGVVLAYKVSRAKARTAARAMRPPRSTIFLTPPLLS